LYDFWRSIEYILAILNDLVINRALDKKLKRKRKNRKAIKTTMRKTTESNADLSRDESSSKNCQVHSDFYFRVENIR